jgi:pyridoxine 5-phosphate synthase
VTTEGGLDVADSESHLKDVVAQLRDAGIPTSAFIDAESRQVEAAANCGFAVCEVHTGPFAHAHHASASSDETAAALETVASAGRLILQHGMQFNAGHALNYTNVVAIAALPGLQELHIGHAIISRSITTGLQEAVRDMVRIVTEASA